MPMEFKGNAMDPNSDLDRMLLGKTKELQVGYLDRVSYNH